MDLKSREADEDVDENADYEHGLNSAEKREMVERETQDIKEGLEREIAILDKEVR